jgi:Domain of unknown function DUF302
MSGLWKCLRVIATMHESHFTGHPGSRDTVGWQLPIPSILLSRTMVMNKAILTISAIFVAQFLSTPTMAQTNLEALSPTSPAEGIVRVRSRYGVDETVARLKADIAAKGIRFFTDIDQSQLGASADLPIRPSRLILFGNPPLGVQFLTANPYAGLDCRCEC